MILCLDAGHGGADPGAVGNGLRESDLTEIIAQGVAKRLLPYHVEIYNVPRSDSLADRAQFANNLNADLFVSIHINAGGGTGFESYRYTATSIKTKEYQSTIHATVMDYLRPLGVVNRGRKQAFFTVLGKTQMPAVLLECLFIDNAEDATRLKDAAFLDGLAGAIANGIVQALDLSEKEAVAIVPEWALEAVEWAYAAGIIANKEGSNDFYRAIVMLYRDNKRRGTL